MLEVVPDRLHVIKYDYIKITSLPRFGSILQYERMEPIEGGRTVVRLYGANVVVPFCVVTGRT